LRVDGGERSERRRAGEVQDQVCPRLWGENAELCGHERGKHPERADDLDGLREKAARSGEGERRHRSLRTIVDNGCVVVLCRVRRVSSGSGWARHRTA
jgi:hypothetical protein